MYDFFQYIFLNIPKSRNGQRNIDGHAHPFYYEYLHW